MDRRGLAQFKNLDATYLHMYISLMFYYVVVEPFYSLACALFLLNTWHFVYSTVEKHIYAFKEMLAFSPIVITRKLRSEINIRHFFPKICYKMDIYVIAFCCLLNLVCVERGNYNKRNCSGFIVSTDNGKGEL